MSHRFLLGLFLLLSGCASTRTSISFVKSRVPLDDYREVANMGIAKARGLAPRDNDYLFQKIKKCPLFPKTGIINEFLEPNYKEPAKLSGSMESEVTDYRDTAQYTAILALSVLKNEKKNDSAIEQIVQIKEDNDHHWVADHPFELESEFGLAGRRLIAPKLDGKAEQVNLKTHTYHIEIGYVLYNTVLKKVVHTDTLVTEATLKHFSTKPAISTDRFREMITRGMLEQIAWMACGVDQKVDRSLYIEDSGKSAAQQREAMEAVKTGRFERAEKSLKTALQMDTKNALLYHDLGVLEERSGRPLEAASYFRAAQGKRLFQNIDGDEYTNILKNQFRDFEANQFQSTAYSVIGGYWAMFNRGQSADIKVGAVYPVYRLRQVYNNKFNVVGPQLSEVGEVSIVAVKSGYLVGKINRFMLPDGINVGDFLWFH